MPGTWTSALVTGASSGIGREIAKQLAGEGTDLVVVARDTERLEQLANEVAAAGSTARVEVLTADLADPDQLASVEARLADAGRPVDLLVNNAGFGTYGDFADLPVDGEEREIRVNVIALVRLAHAALGAMKKRGEGTILNVSSVAGLQATPGNATYGATKAFVTSFSEALYEETKGTGVKVSMVLPGFTRTEFQDRAGIEGRTIPKIAWMDADKLAESALKGARAGEPFHVPGLLNKTLVAVTGPLPRSLTRAVAARLTRRL
jgi:short-subunit dehydrogenase